MATVKITQRRSPIGRPADQRATLRALGLTRIGSSVVRPDSPTLRGMLNKVSHLIEVEQDAPIRRPLEQDAPNRRPLEQDAPNRRPLEEKESS